jgi:hypothetical protein
MAPLSRAGRQRLRADQRVEPRPGLGPKRSTLNLWPRWGRRRAGPRGQPRSSADSERKVGHPATAAFVDGRGSPLAAGRTPLAGVGVPAALGSRSWCRRRGGRARRWRPPPGSWPGRHPAAPRTAPAAPRSAGPRPGRARSPPDQRIEHKFEDGSGTLRSPTGPLRVWVAALGSQLSRTWGQQRTAGD